MEVLGRNGVDQPNAVGGAVEGVAGPAHRGGIDGEDGGVAMAGANAAGGRDVAREVTWWRRILARPGFRSEGTVLSLVPW